MIVSFLYGMVAGAHLFGLLQIFYKIYRETRDESKEKEQQNQEAITLLKEWKERDGSEIEENYNKLIKEQENGE